MFENEKAIRELESQLLLFEAASKSYVKKARRWLVALTLSLSVISWLVTGSAWMGLGTGVVVFVLLWSSLASTTRRQRNMMASLYNQLYVLRQNGEFRSGFADTDRVFEWPEQSDRPFIQ